MAILTDADRTELKNKWARRLSRDRELFSLSSLDTKAAVDAADDWVEANQAAYNTALPVAARNNLTAKQKAELLMFVIDKRFGVL